MQGKGREGFERDVGKKRKNLKLEWFPASPSQILPTFCHGNEVKPWKFEKKITKIISFVWREGGRKEEKSLTNKQTREIVKSKGNSLTNKI